MASIHAAVVQFFADRGAVDEDGMTALMYAALEGNLAAVRCLIEAGADVHTVADDGRTLLACATEGGNIEIVRFLLGLGMDENAVNKHGKTLLMYAAEGGFLDIVRYLVDRGANVNKVSGAKWTALMYAAGGCHLDVVRYFLERGADVNAASSTGWTALMQATSECHFKNIDIVRCLVEHGAAVGAATRSGSTALSVAIAASHIHIDVVEYLVELGADVNAAKKSGWTLLMQSVVYGPIELTRCLVERGANVNAADTKGKTALMYASVEGHINEMRYLVERGADVNAACNDGKTALMYAVEDGPSVSELRCLVELGADVNAADKHGKTALMEASSAGREKIVQYLVELGAGRTSHRQGGCEDEADVAPGERDKETEREKETERKLTGTKRSRSDSFSDFDWCHKLMRVYTNENGFLRAFEPTRASLKEETFDWLGTSIKMFMKASRRPSLALLDETEIKNLTDLVITAAVNDCDPAEQVTRLNADRVVTRRGSKLLVHVCNSSKDDMDKGYARMAIGTEAMLVEHLEENPESSDSVYGLVTDFRSWQFMQLNKDEARFCQRSFALDRFADSLRVVSGDLLGILRGLPTRDINEERDWRE